MALTRHRADPAAQRRALRDPPRRGRRRRRAAPRARDGLVHLHLPLVEHCARRFRNRGEPLRGPGPGRHDRADQVDRPVRHRARRRVLDVRHPDDHRRDQALLPRQGLGDPGAAAAPGAADADRRGHRRAHPDAWAAPPRRASSPRRSAARSRRSSRASSRATPTRRSPSTPSDDSDDGAATHARRDRRSTTRASSTSRSASRSSRCSTGSAPREKKILLLRFFKNMTQSQIAEEIGVSQMHVSRLLTRTLEQLRTSLEERRAEPRRRSRRASPCVGERVDARRVEQPDQHDHRDHARARPRRQVVSAAAEAPGHAQADQLGEHDRAPRPRAARGPATRRTRQQPAPYASEEDGSWSRPSRPGRSRRLASSSTAKHEQQQRPRRPTSDAATTSGAGRLADGRRLTRGSLEAAGDRPDGSRRRAWTL